MRSGAGIVISMRILVDRATNEILQVEKVPSEGETVPLNGKYILPTPEGVTVHVDSDSFVLPSSDPGSVVAQAYAGLLAQFPQYENVLYNPLLLDTDVDDLDLTGLFIDPDTSDEFTTRAQMGRGTGGPWTSGQAPINTAMLEANGVTSPTRPGLLITDTIDISPFTLDPFGIPVGTDEFVVYWYIYECETTEDIHSDFGAQAGVNNPAFRNVIETDQEPADLQVYISINDGTTWVEVQRLLPVAFCNKGKLIRLAFRNNGTTKVYLAAYAILF